MTNFSTAAPETAVSLQTATTEELNGLSQRLQCASTAAAVKEFGYARDEPSPSDDVYGSLRGEKVQVLHRLQGGKHIGGACASIDPTTNHNSLDFLFVDGGRH